MADDYKFTPVTKITPEEHDDILNSLYINDNSEKYWPDDRAFVPYAGDKSIESVVDHIYINNQEFFKNLKTVTYETKTLAIDGTCCNGKTTICNKFVENGGSAFKINNFLPFKAINTDPIAAVSYVINAIIMHKKESNSRGALFDRTGYNNILWNKLWQSLITVTREKGNVTHPISLLKKYMPKSILPANLLTWVKNICPVIILVNRNEHKNNQKLFERGTNSDKYRAEHLANYIGLQNLYYYDLHQLLGGNSLIIDNGQYDHVPMDVIQSAILHIIDDIFKKMNVAERKIPKHDSMFNSYVSNKYNSDNLSMNLGIFDKEKTILNIQLENIMKENMYGDQPSAKRQRNKNYNE